MTSSCTLKGNESGTYPCSTQKRQIKFWTNLNQNLTTNSSLKKTGKKPK